MLETITIRVIPHKEQRYPTVGDWRTPEEGFSGTEIVVSEMGDPDYEFLVAIHELIEWYLAKCHCVSAKDVTKFDEEFERKRKPGDNSEPGDQEDCPVFREHQIATVVERLLATELCVNWQRYEEKVKASSTERKPSWE